MKTHNHHPVWHNQPLRLNEEETNSPKLALYEFFQCYHLKDVREILWQWLSAVVSTRNSAIDDSNENNNHLFFYEKIETLVEAAWILVHAKDQTNTPANPAHIIRDTKHIDKTGADRFSKPPRLIEEAITNPEETIYKVFDQTPLDELQDYFLPNWLRVALINPQCAYSGNDREILHEFYDQLLLFVEALYFSSEDTPACDMKLLNEEQMADPTSVINNFFHQFSIDYIRRELSDFMEAGIGYEGNYPNGFTPWQAWMTYNHILCLTEAAYQLHITRQLPCYQQALISA